VGCDSFTAACQPVTMQYNWNTIQLAAGVALNESELPFVKQADSFVTQHCRGLAVDGMSA